MPKVVSGTYRTGKIELGELPSDVAENTPVLVTFVEPSVIDLRALGISEAQAADARAHLATFAADWDSPEMSVYDDYDAAHRQSHR